MKIDEKSAFIVTGGASGLGEAVVRRIVAEGGNAFIFDLNDESGAALVTEFKGKVGFASVDVASEESVQKGIDACIKQFGTLNGVVQCAGIGGAQRVLSGKGVVHSLKAFERVVNINLVGTFNVVRLATAVMAKLPAVDGERGVFVHTASVAAFDGQIGQAAYAASKSAVVGMTLPIARELGGLGIRVNTIAPGLFRTPMTDALPEKAAKSLYSQVPFPRRFGEPSEFADLAISMIKNQYFNGSTVRLDGSIRMSAL